MRWGAGKTRARPSSRPLRALNARSPSTRDSSSPTTTSAMPGNARRAMRWTSGLDPRPVFAKADLGVSKAIEMRPEYANAYNNSGIALWRRGHLRTEDRSDPNADLGQAVTAFDAAIFRNPTYAYAYANRGLARRTWRSSVSTMDSTHCNTWTSRGTISTTRSLSTRRSSGRTPKKQRSRFCRAMGHARRQGTPKAFLTQPPRGIQGLDGQSAECSRLSKCRRGPPLAS